MKKIKRKFKFYNFIALILAAVMAFAVYSPVFADANEAAENEHSGVGGGYAISGQLSGVGYMAKVYDATNGLPTSEANAVLGSKDGYVWLGGYSGIIRYDGTVFERLPSTNGLTNCRGLFEDSSGRIWVATNDNGVVVIDRNSKTHLTKSDGLTSSSNRCFAEDKEGNVYVGSTAGVCYVDRSMKVHLVDDERIMDQRVLRLVTDSVGEIYGQASNGMVFSVNDGRITDLYKSEDLGMEKITTIFADPKEEGVLYFGTEGEVMYHGHFGDKADNMEKINTAPISNLHWISYDCGRIWISSNSLIGYLDSDNKVHTVSNIPMDTAIEMTTADYQGNIWAVSSRQGIMKLVSSNFTDFTKDAGLADEVVNSTCKYKGELYIGTEKGIRVVGADNKPLENDLSRHLGDTRIRCIMADSNSNLWVSTFTNNMGLVCMRADGSILDYTTENGMASNEIRCTLEMSDGSIVAGTNNGIVVIKDGQIVRKVTTEDGLHNAVILTVCEGENGTIYAGSDGDGIYVIMDNYVNRISTQDGLTSDVIMRLTRDDTNNLIWIVTSNSIEYIKNGYIKEIKSFPYNNSYELKTDKNGNIWALASAGIYVAKMDDMIYDKVTDYRKYNLSNGLTSLPNGNSYSFLDEEGNLYVAGKTGVSKVNINSYFEDSADIKTRISSVYLGDREIIPDDKGVYTLPSERGRIQITPAVLDFSMSNPTVHIFLEGAHDDGITTELDKLTALEYTNLDYGNYTLHIQILGKSAGEVISDSKYSIVKNPRFLEMLSVRILLVMLLVALVGLVVWRVINGTVIRKQYVEIREAKDEAERANLAKSRFLANMSHEIRTPINTILGMDEMIMREDITGVPNNYFLSMINYATDIKTATDSLLNLINDLLDISKIESGKMHLVEQEYSTEEMLRGIITMIRVRSEAKSLYFLVDIDKELPKRLYGDDGKIKQIVLNLLTNAVKYTEEGGFTLKVEVKEKNDLSCNLRFSVKDTGIGVKPEDTDKLFSAYERLDEEKNSGIQGTGLGLNISRQFAELMEGNLWCESVYGEGSEFILTCAQKIVDPQTVGEFKEIDDATAPGPYVPQFIAPDADVLVVDDTPMNLRVIKGLLKPTKIFVTTASSGMECLDKLRTGSFNVVLLDHMMPVMDGLETCEKIRELYPDLPVYALTAKALSDGEEFYKSKGFNGYLTKPIDTVVLERTIMQHLPEEIIMKPDTSGFEFDLEEIPEEMKWIYDIEELSVDDGIKHSGGITNFVYALQLFYDTIDDSAKIIENAYREDDIKLFTIKVHSLKSSARIVGLMDFSMECQRMENAGNDGDTKYISDNAEGLLEKYRGYKEVFARLQPPEEVEDDSDKEPVPEGELEDAYNALREVVPQMDYDSVEMILDQLGQYRLPDKDKEIMNQLSKLLKTFDWDKMEELINQ